MRNILKGFGIGLLLFGIFGCAKEKAGIEVYTIQVTCPITLYTTTVDTVRRVTHYFYKDNALRIMEYGKNSLFFDKQYPNTCVVKTLEPSLIYEN